MNKEEQIQKLRQQMLEGRKSNLTPEQQNAIKYFKRVIKATLFGLLILLITWIFKWKFIPFSAFEFWTIKGSIIDWIKPGIFFLLFASVQGWIKAFMLERMEDQTGFTPFAFQHPTAAMIFGSIKCGLIAVFEELVFRWIIFFGAIATVQIINALTIGAFAWFYSNIMGPLANLGTFTLMDEYLFHPKGWFVGAGIITANALFRDGHRYQGWIGWVNSWFGGMYLFWCMMTFGLPAAITFHFVYNAIIELTPPLLSDSRKGAHRK